jgi:hypothetical protein
VAFHESGDLTSVADIAQESDHDLFAARREQHLDLHGAAGIQGGSRAPRERRAPQCRRTRQGPIAPDELGTIPRQGSARRSRLAPEVDERGALAELLAEDVARDDRAGRTLGARHDVDRRARAVLAEHPFGIQRDRQPARPG